MDDTGCGELTNLCFCLSFLLISASAQHVVPPMGYSPSWTAPVWVLPTGFHLKNCFSIGTLNGLQSLRSRLLQQVSPIGLSSCWKPASAQALYGLQSPSGHIHLLWCGLLLGQEGNYLLHCGLPQAALAQPTSIWCSPQAEEESLLQHLEHLPLGVCRTVSHILSLHSQSIFYSFVFMLLHRCHQYHWLA